MILSTNGGFVKMNRVLRGLGYLVGSVVVLVGGFIAYCAIDGIPHFKQPLVDVHVEVTPERVARGKKFVDVLCAECHKNPTTGRLTGKLMEDAPREFGEIHSRNITSSKEHGIGGWTDGELISLLRTGIARDGRYTPPWMAKLPHMADEDLYSIVAFLRSDDALVKASDEPSLPCKVTLLSKVLTHTVFRPLELPTAVQIAPPKTDKVAYGRYLVTHALICFECHSADFKTMNLDEPEKSPGFLGGDNALVGLSQEKVYSANLTPDAETGIGKWSEAQLKRALRDGIRPDNTLVRYPMEPMRDLDDDDIAAMYAYLKQVPAIHKARHPNPPLALAANATDGQKIYYKYGCNSCHGERGVGVGDLRGAHKKYATDDAMKAWIRNAPSFKPETKMPTWEGVIADNEYAPLMQYVRKLGQDAEREGVTVGGTAPGGK
jgi:mono/diheme cytochrome c family protein